MSSPGAFPKPKRQPPLAWLSSRPPVQALLNRPKVRWLLTHPLPLRWRRIHYWPPVFLAFNFADTIRQRVLGPAAGMLAHLAIDALYLALVALVLATDRYLARRARRLNGIRSRSVYLAMAAAPLTLAVVGVYLAVRFNAQHPGISDVLTLIWALSGWTALLALGRALTWGHIRRLCWLYPPAGSSGGSDGAAMGIRKR